MDFFRMRDNKMMLMFTFGIVLILVLMSNIFLLTKRYRELTDSNLTYPAYKFQKWITVQYPLIYEDEAGDTVSENTKNEIAELFEKCSETDAEVLFYTGMNFGNSNDKCDVAFVLTDGVLPIKTTDAEMLGSSSGIFLGEGYEHYMDGRYVYSDGKYYPVTDVFKTKGTVTDEIAYIFFSSVDETEYDEYIFDKLTGLAVLDLYVTLCIGSNENEPAEAVEEIIGFIDGCSELSVGSVEDTYMVSSSRGESNRQSVIIQTALNVAVSAIALVSLFQLVNLQMSRRKRDIAVLRTVGFSRGQCFMQIYADMLKVMVLSVLICTLFELVILVGIKEYDMVTTMTYLLFSWLSTMVIVSGIALAAFGRQYNKNIVDVLRYE